MAHVVSRNAGYLMTNLAERPGAAPMFTRDALDEMLLAFPLVPQNFLIFHDAWVHVLMHLLGAHAELAPPTPRFVKDAWLRYEDASRGGVDAALERALVLDLVTNEQHLIEHRAVNHPRLSAPPAPVVGFAGFRWANECPIA